MIARRMSTLETLPTKDLTAFHDQIQRRYDAFKKRGLKLDLTRGKPSSEQLDLSNGLLGCPAPTTSWPPTRPMRATTASLQGLPELRALLAPLFGVDAGTGHPRRQLQPGADARRHRYALLKGTVGSPRPWCAGVARRVPLPGARLRPPLRHLPGLRHRDDPGAARRRRAGHGRGRAAGRRRTPRSRACGACRSTATRPARSIRQRRSSGSRRCRRPRRTSACSGTTPTPCIT